MSIAIIDIGSNAIRAVIYDTMDIGASEVYNDKFMVNFLSLFELNDIDINHEIYLILGHFSELFRKMNIQQIKCVATEVLRSNSKAYLFIKIVKNRYGLDINIISGEQEAYLTASGILWGIPKANGLAVDLGGGSLEFAEIENKKIGNLLSLPLGTKIIRKLYNDINHIEEGVIKKISAYNNFNKKYSNLYLIGGALRLIANHYIKYTCYPIRILHNLTISSFEVLEYCKKIDELWIHDNYQELYNIDIYAIYILKSIIKIFNPERIVISNYGLKEGIYFTNLSSEQQNQDVIWNRMKFIMPNKSSEQYKEKYIDLINKLLIRPDEKTIQIIELVLLLFTNIKGIDKILVGNFLNNFVLNMDIPFCHSQRVMLITTLSCTLNVKVTRYMYDLSRKILPIQDYLNSCIIGNVLKIAKLINGPNLENIGFDLVVNANNYIEFVSHKLLPHQILSLIYQSIKIIGKARKKMLYKF